MMFSTSEDLKEILRHQFVIIQLLGCFKCLHAFENCERQSAHFLRDALALETLLSIQAFTAPKSQDTLEVV